MPSAATVWEREMLSADSISEGESGEGEQYWAENSQDYLEG
jgi:hypothetical protein